MTKTELWFQKLHDIWMRKAVGEVGKLMTDDFVYYEDPFSAPITDVATLKAVWTEIEQQDIEILEITPLHINDKIGTAHYHFVAQIDGQRHESRGVYFVRLDDSDRATEFRQWFMESK
jgi:hypothetical protein